MQITFMAPVRDTFIEREFVLKGNNGPRAQEMIKLKLKWAPILLERGLLFEVVNAKGELVGPFWRWFPADLPISHRIKNGELVEIGIPHTIFQGTDLVVSYYYKETLEP